MIRFSAKDIFHCQSTNTFILFNAQLLPVMHKEVQHVNVLMTSHQSEISYRKLRTYFCMSINSFTISPNYVNDPVRDLEREIIKTSNYCQINTHNISVKTTLVLNQFRRLNNN